MTPALTAFTAWVALGCVAHVLSARWPVLAGMVPVCIGGAFAAFGWAFTEGVLTSAK